MLILTMTILPTQRHLFDIPEHIAYFNCAYSAPLLHASRQRLISGVAVKNHPWDTKPADYFEDAETIRALAATVFGGERDGYAVIPAASYGLSAAARAIEPQLQAGDGILLIAEEFPSNVLPWQRVAKERGAVVITVPQPEDGNWTSAIVNRINQQISVVAVSPCHWTNGAYIDLVAIRQACNASGCLLVIDATQTLGAMPFPLEQVQPDFLVAAGYKWLLGPYGFGLMYVAPQWRDARPLEETWLARDNAEDFASLVKYSDTYMPGARRFDVGEKCTWTILPGAIAALEQLREWGISNIAETLSVINKKIAAHLDSLGFLLPDDTQRCPHMFGAVIPGRYKGNLVAALRERQVFISQRGSAIRFSPHLYNNERDVNRLLEMLDELVGS
jgi:selenocysteine lyase/cysteine desulfurase